MAKSTHRLRRSSGRKDVFSSGRCLLQMARGDRDARYYCTDYGGPVTQCFCEVGNSTASGVRQFVAQEVDRFMSLNNIKHLTSSPYHLATNGQAERFVQTLKQALKVSKCKSKSLQHCLASFLLQYRNSLHASTETSPALLMIGRELHSRLHLLKPNLRGTTLKASTRQFMSRSAATERLFSPGEKVLVRDYRPGHARWQSGVGCEGCGGQDVMRFSVRMGVCGSATRIRSGPTP